MNVTTVKFDDDLKCLFDKARVELDREINLLSLHQEGIKQQEKAQKIIYEWFVKHIDEVNFVKSVKKNGKKTQPNMFALMCGVMSDYKNKKNWTEILGDYDMINGVGMSVKEGDKITIYDVSGSKITEENCYCACGHTIHNLFELKSTPNQTKLIVGCDCIKKVIILNPKLEQSLKDAKKKITNMKKYRACVDCNEFKILKKLPAYNKRCLECWKADLEKKKETHRQCVSCGSYNIKDTEPSWKKRCSYCYRNSKKNFNHT